MKWSRWMLAAALGLGACEGNDAVPDGRGVGGAEANDEMVTERQEERIEAREDEMGDGDPGEEIEIRGAR